MRAGVRRRRGSASNALQLTNSLTTPAVPTCLSPDALIRVSHSTPTAMFMGRDVLAEYVRLPGNGFARIDAAVDMISASGIVDGHVVLVNGASGSVGSILVQLYKLRGAKVVGAASGGNEAMARVLGVAEFIDYTSMTPLPDYLAHQHFFKSPAYLKPDGAVINIGALEGFGVTMRNYLVNTWLPTWLGHVQHRYVMFSTPPACDDSLHSGHG
ncbi:hypothetical protein BDW66DRAFT_167537 [Aspergillus desertorum]